LITDERSYRAAARDLGIEQLHDSAAMIGPKWFTQRRTLSYETAIPALGQQIRDVAKA
jgi:hypothetical protein